MLCPQKQGQRRGSVPRSYRKWRQWVSLRVMVGYFSLLFLIPRQAKKPRIVAGLLEDCGWFILRWLTVLTHLEVYFIVRVQVEASWRDEDEDLLWSLSFRRRELTRPDHLNEPAFPLSCPRSLLASLPRSFHSFILQSFLFPYSPIIIQSIPFFISSFSLSVYPSFHFLLLSHNHFMFPISWLPCVLPSLNRSFHPSIFCFFPFFCLP